MDSTIIAATPTQLCTVFANGDGSYSIYAGVVEVIPDTEDYRQHLKPFFDAIADNVNHATELEDTGFYEAEPECTE